MEKEKEIVAIGGNRLGKSLLAEQRKHYDAWKLKKSLAELRRDYYEPADQLQQQAAFHYEEYIKIRGQIKQLTKNENRYT